MLGHLKFTDLARYGKIVLHLLHFLVATGYVHDWPIPCSIAHAVESFTRRSAQ
jgi:hypothetical protein